MAKPQTIDLEIEGMTCTACARRVEKSLNKVPGVSAFVDFATETAHIQGVASLETLKAAVEDTGYHVGSKRETSRPILIRLGVGVPLTLLFIYFMVTGQMIMGGWPYWLAIAGDNEKLRIDVFEVRVVGDAIEVDGDQPINVRATFTGAWRRPSADELSHIAAGTWPGVQVGA